MIECKVNQGKQNKTYTSLSEFKAVVSNIFLDYNKY